MRIYEAAEKVRKTLSGDTEASMNVDYLLNEEDLHRKINREEWTTIVDPVTRRFNDLVTQTLGIGSKYSFISLAVLSRYVYLIAVESTLSRIGF